ncbi:hypothetical protein L3Q72_10540 [Vibrio sp. JC009]|uniref:hypothetical protein n=1 Tax=Vibrio sp. JC009 TaxID=2912314 RepID=UPI0023B02141|nr:hypothetical protein [Vibrio sp. JC009]WED21075.1 hypothetical protein L3Q72_10540 [Vibrio sp. JC009]
MHRDLVYIGAEATKINFELASKSPNGSGFYKYYMNLNDELEFVVFDETNESFLLIVGKCGVDGFLGKEPDESKERVFELGVEFFLKFKLDGIKPSDFSKQELESSNWYFNSLAHVEAKKIIESVIENTMLKGTVIPADPREYRAE